LGILANPAGNSEGFDKKMENLNGRGGVYDYGNPRAWGDKRILEIPKAGGLKYGSRLWYGMDIFWNRPLYGASKCFIGHPQQKFSLRIC